MPRVSEKKILISNLEKLEEDRAQRRILKGALSVDLDGEGSDLVTIFDTVVTASKLSLLNERYLQRHKYRKGHSKEVFSRDLQEEGPDGQAPWLLPAEFQEKHRMRRESFWSLHGMTKNHPIFHSNNGKKKQAPPEHQLLVFLHCLGTSGSGASNPRLRNAFGIGRGTAQLYRDRACVAVRSLHNLAMMWPDHEERVDLAKSIQYEYNLPNCIGMADGTLLPLTYEPQSEDAGDYHGRKGGYTLSVLIINDHNRRVMYYLSGFPGTAHDNKVYKATKLYKHPEQYFDNMHYIIGDSAFENSSTMVSAFKAPAGHSLAQEESDFNTRLGKARVACEHVIGMLKGRFPWMRSIPMVITDNERSIKRVLKYLDCCFIMHNLLLNNDELPDEWMDVDDAISDIAAAVGDDDLAGAIMPDEPKDSRRRKLMDYFRDYGGPV